MLEITKKKYMNKKVFYETILNSIPADLVVFSKNHEYLFINPTSVKKDPTLDPG